jgi:hypothetical protein
MKLSFRYRYVEKHDDAKWIVYEEADVETYSSLNFIRGSTALNK